MRQAGYPSSTFVYSGLSAITANTTLYVSASGNDTTGDGSSGSPWRTITKAFDYLKNRWINTDVAVTIQLADGNNGDHVYTSEIAPNHPCGSQITIKGENTHSKSMTSVQSSSGSAGDYSVILNLDSVADIEANDYVMISGAANGTNPTYVMGIHKVTNVDSGNSRITINSLHKTGVPSGAVTATVLVLKTVVNFNGCDGFVVRNGHHINLENLAIVGNGTSNTVGVFAGGDDTANDYASCGGSITCVTGTVGVSGFAQGYLAQYSGSIRADSSTASGNSQQGYVAQSCGSIRADSSTASGNSEPGYLAQFSGSIRAYASTASGNSRQGYVAQYSGSISAGSSTASGNSEPGYVAQSCGSIWANSSTSNNNTYGYYAYSYGYIRANGYSASGNSTAALSPAANTQGNEYGYIDT